MTQFYVKGSTQFKKIRETLVKKALHVLRSASSCSAHLTEECLDNLVSYCITTGAKQRQKVYKLVAQLESSSPNTDLELLGNVASRFCLDAHAGANLVRRIKLLTSNHAKLENKKREVIILL